MHLSFLKTFHSYSGKVKARVCAWCGKQSKSQTKCNKRKKKSYYNNNEHTKQKPKIQNDTEKIQAKRWLGSNAIRWMHEYWFIGAWLCKWCDVVLAWIGSTCGNNCFFSGMKRFVERMMLAKVLLAVSHHLNYFCNQKYIDLIGENNNSFCCCCCGFDLKLFEIFRIFFFFLGGGPFNGKKNSFLFIRWVTNWFPVLARNIHHVSSPNDRLILLL